MKVIESSAEFTGTYSVSIQLHTCVYVCIYANLLNSFGSTNCTVTRVNKRDNVKTSFQFELLGSEIREINQKINRPDVTMGHRRVTKNKTGCEFDSHNLCKLSNNFRMFLLQFSDKEHD